MPARKILVIGPSWIGDMVMAQSLFMAIHQRYTASVIDVLAPAWTLPIVERMPEVHRAIALPSQHGRLGLAMRWRIGRELSKESYDEAIVIPRSIKAALPAFFAGITKRVGYGSRAGLINQVKPLNRSRSELFVRRLLKLAIDDAYELSLDDIPKPALQVDLSNQKTLLDKFGLNSGKFVVICPGAEYGPAKRWPATHFAELADLLDTKGIEVVIMGAAKDAEVAGEIVAQVKIGNVLDLCGKTALPDVVDLMAASYAVVCNDSGLMHVACAAGARVVAVFGSSSPEYTPPLSEFSTVLKTELACQPCFERTCRFGHYECLVRIAANNVYFETLEHAE